MPDDESKEQRGDLPLRVFCGGDAHCGHLVGLTPPDFDVDHGDGTPELQELDELRRSMWRWFAWEINKLRPFHVAIWNGDMIDGKGEKSGGTELIEPDLTGQCQIATAVIEYVGAKSDYMAFGTPYHVGGTSDFERIIANNVGAREIRSVWNVKVNGVMFNYKHFISGSGVPHGRHTAVAREHLWSILWKEYADFPRADVLLRSHVHYHDYCGEVDWLALTLPALCGYGGKHGERRCSGLVHFGFVYFDVWPDGRMRWDKRILKIKPARMYSVEESER